MPAASALSCAGLKKNQLLSAPMRGHHSRTNENTHEWLRNFVLGDDHGGTSVATVIHLAMCPTSVSLFLHSYVFCEEPPVVDHVAIIEVLQGAP